MPRRSARLPRSRRCAACATRRGRRICAGPRNKRRRGVPRRTMPRCHVRLEAIRLPPRWGMGTWRRWRISPPIRPRSPVPRCGKILLWGGRIRLSRGFGGGATGSRLGERVTARADRIEAAPISQTIVGQATNAGCRTGTSSPGSATLSPGDDHRIAHATTAPKPSSCRRTSGVFSVAWSASFHTVSGINRRPGEIEWPSPTQYSQTLAADALSPDRSGHGRRAPGPGMPHSSRSRSGYPRSFAMRQRSIASIAPAASMTSA
jgi:hypothetical protein